MTQNQTQDDKNQNQAKESIIHEDDEVNTLEESFPKTPNKIIGGDAKLIKFQDFWFSNTYLKNILSFRKSFQAQDTDIIIASLPKCGTTWLKSLLFSVINRKNFPTNRSPLLSNHPQDLVYRLENGIYRDSNNSFCPISLQNIPSPRLFNTHLPYTILPKSIKTSECRILYISRNPLDSCVSQWHFYTKLRKNTFESYSVQDYFEDYIEGKIMYGPHFEHVVEYWKMSLQRPDKVLFLKYEDLKEDPIFQLKRVAEFVGVPFSEEEESGGVIKDIVALCNINNLKDLEVNKNGVHTTGLGNIESKDFFRKGIVGDWTNYFTPSMGERMCNLMKEKFEGTGLTFKITT